MSVLFPDLAISAYPSRENCHFPDAVTRAIDERRRIEGAENLATLAAEVPPSAGDRQQGGINEQRFPRVQVRGDFRVSGTCLTLLPHHPPARRRHALMQARLRAGYGSTPLITSYDLPNVRFCRTLSATAVPRRTAVDPALAEDGRQSLRQCQ